MIEWLRFHIVPQLEAYKKRCGFPGDAKVTAHFAVLGTGYLVPG
jgi:hypothetical protein